MDIRRALESITGDGLMRHVEVLASDEFEGRAPGTRGEELTVDYLVSQFHAIGLEPGNPDGTHVQEVPLEGFTPTVTAHFAAGGRRLAFGAPGDFIAVTRRLVPEVSVDDSEIVFVGYGIVAPEYGWDDYKGLDVRGKTLLMMIGDPSRPDPDDPSKPDERFFMGRGMTYYGRWTYKYEVATEKGAAAAVIVHKTSQAGYPYDVLIRGWSRESFEIATPDKNLHVVPVEAWMRGECARELASAAGHDYDALERAAERPDFEPVALGARASFEVRNALRDVRSRNVVAKLPGSDPMLAGEAVVYTAHWDHLGADRSLEGHQVFNGAVDNATGVAALLELARAYTRLPERPRRSILFLATTAEESGLLGARYYATNPLVPLDLTAANVNMDMLNPWGRTRDVSVLGLGTSTIDEIAREVAAAQGRVVTGDAEPEKGLFYRSDHFEFVRRGVPAFYTKTGMDFVGRPPGFGRARRDEFTRTQYHKVTDVVGPDWDLSGTIEEVRLLFEVGYRVAQADERPRWMPGARESGFLR